MSLVIFPPLCICGLGLLIFVGGFWVFVQELQACCFPSVPSLSGWGAKDCASFIKQVWKHFPLVSSGRVACKLMAFVKHWVSRSVFYIWWCLLNIVSNLSVAQGSFFWGVVVVLWGFFGGSLNYKLSFVAFRLSRL